MEKKKGLSLQTILTIAGLALVYLLAFLLDRIPGVPIMLTTVLRKGAIYSLVAVSMNLLNGFTGLFSLGQAGFMLVGAYTFAAINISSGIRSTVYQYYEPLCIRDSIWPSRRSALPKLSAPLSSWRRSRLSPTARSSCAASRILRIRSCRS